MIGIDLGTTNSLVAIFENGVPRILANELGEELTPSAVAIAEDGTVLVGRAAKDRLIIDPDAGVMMFKRDMGTAREYFFGGKSWNPVTCSALILQEMKRVAEMHLGNTIERAVITVPAYFHDQQRQATIEAANIAGLKVERIINEPTAAALAYGYKNPNEEKKILVFDLGGGTFDVTLLEIFEGVIEVKASAGESRLGGEDYTDTLCSFLEKKYQWQPAAEQRGAWRQRVEIVKRQLARQLSTRVLLHKEMVEVTRADLIESTKLLTSRIRPVLARCLQDSQTHVSELHDVLLVGGASRMQLVHELIFELLKCQPQQKIDPDRVVAMGACIQAALCASDDAVDDLVLTDVCPHTLGIEITKTYSQNNVEPGFFCPIIDRNTTIPVSRSKPFSTIHPEQDMIKVQVFQGEARLTKENQKIGEIVVRNLKSNSGANRLSEIEVRFSYDMNGILEVDVTNIETGKVSSLVIEQRPGVLTKAQLREALDRMRPLKMHPRDLLPNRARLERANRLFAELIGPTREQLSYMIDQFENALRSQDSQLIKQQTAVLDTFLRDFFPLEREMEQTDGEND